MIGLQEGSVLDAGQLSAALLELEDEVNWDAAPMLDQAWHYERQARVLGDELLVARARLCQANLHMRGGDLAEAARHIWRVHQWAVEHEATQLTARAHLVWANIHRNLGDAGQCLEHAVLCVELLDDTATDHMRIWHRVKLGDALSETGSIDAARQRYQQAAELATRCNRADLLLALLNNYAYAEYAAGDRDRALQVVARLEDHAASHELELDAAMLDTIGVLQIETGQHEAAERTLLSGIDRHRHGREDDADSLPEFLLTLARAQRGQGAHRRAQHNLDASRRLCAERDLGHVLVRVHQEQAELHAARGEFAAAFAAHREFFEAFRRQHSLELQAQARTRQVMFETAEAREEAERFREQARRDPLTGLHNRRFIDEELPTMVASDRELTLALIDVDHFKRINDQLSHGIGDQVLVQVARLLDIELAAVAPTGFVARMGGEEFLVVLPGTPVDVAAAQLDDIREAVCRHDWQALTSGMPVTVSIGVAGVGDALAATQPALLSIADRNLYAAKHGGRNRLVSAA